MPKKISIRGVFLGAANAIGGALHSLFGLLTEDTSVLLLEDDIELEYEHS